MSNKIQYNKLNTEKFIKKSKDIHKDLYNYSKTNYTGANDYVIIICQKHGEFKQLPNNHYKYGCGKCGREKNKRCIYLKEESKNNFVLKSQNIHGDKYNYNKSEYITSVKKIIITCNLHGDFEITPNNHLRGKGCPKCGIIKSRLSKVKTWDEYYEFFINKYGNTYDYSKVNWVNASTKIIVVCKKHGEFEIDPYNHKNGRGCISCSN